MGTNHEFTIVYSYSKENKESFESTKPFGIQHLVANATVNVHTLFYPVVPSFLQEGNLQVSA